MPVKDGFATLKEIKKNDQWKSIPVLIASNLGQQEDIDKGLAMGAQDYIVKSNLSINDLVAKIHTITDGT
jgi:DNA-binding response OmpR family regulator